LRVGNRDSGTVGAGGASSEGTSGAGGVCSVVFSGASLAILTVLINAICGFDDEVEGWV
jgi:hypothetical protein